MSFIRPIIIHRQSKNKVSFDQLDKSCRCTNCNKPIKVNVLKRKKSVKYCYYCYLHYVKKIKTIQRQINTLRFDLTKKRRTKTVVVKSVIEQNKRAWN